MASLTFVVVLMQTKASRLDAVTYREAYQDIYLVGLLRQCKHTFRISREYITVLTHVTKNDHFYNIIWEVTNRTELLSLIVLFTNIWMH